MERDVSDINRSYLFYKIYLCARFFWFFVDLLAISEMIELYFRLLSRLALDWIKLFRKWICFYRQAQHREN